MTSTLFTHLWQSTLFVAVIWVMALALRRYRAGVRHGLWLAASVKFLLPIALLVSLGQTMPFARRLAPPALQPAFFNVKLPSRGEEARRFLLVRSDGVAASPQPASTMPVRTLTAIWALGVILIAGRWARQWMRMRRIARAATPVAGGREVEALGRLRAASGSRARLEVRVTDAPIEPGVFGISRPVLLWPNGLSEQLSDAEVDSILAHEFTHVMRRDNASGLLQQIVQALFWFHPAVWWIGARLVDERERACDEHVVSTRGDREVYARSILTTCRFAIEPPLPCVAAVSGADLSRRVAEIVGGSVGRPLGTLPRLGLSVGACLAVMAPLIFGVLNAPPLQARARFVVRQRAASGPKPSFEVASVKENVSGARDVRINLRPGGGLTVTNMTLADMVRFAYQTQSFQIVAGPDWVRKTRFDVVAKVEGDMPPAQPGTIGPMQLMMQSLLEERFTLRLRPDTREMPIYALVMARGDRRLGAHLSQSNVDCEAIMRGALRGGPPPPPPAPGGTPMCGIQVRLGSTRAGGFPLSEFAKSLAGQLQRVVVDDTGLTGNFDLDLSYTPEQLPTDVPPNAPPIDPNGPSLFTAVQEQLGLKLEPKRGPVDVLVIDGAEQPTVD